MAFKDFLRGFLNIGKTIFGFLHAPRQRFDGGHMTFYKVRMIGSFFVTMIVCSNCAAIVLSIVRRDQPSFSSVMRPIPVVRNGSMASTRPSVRTRRSRGLS